MKRTFTITILGSGAAVPDAHRNCSAQLVALGERHILLDCAEGTMKQMVYHHEEYTNIDTICITHLHGDHCLGLAPLIFSYCNAMRKAPLLIIGPKGVKELVAACLYPTPNAYESFTRFIELDSDAFAKGEAGETTGACDAFSNGEAGETTGAEGRLVRVGEGGQIVEETEGYRIIAFPLDHSVACFGYLIEEKCEGMSVLPEGQGKGAGAGVGGRYAYCIDTAYLPTLTPIIKGVDLLCLEATYANDHRAEAALYRHSTAEQSATLAREAGVRQLLITHFSSRYDDEEQQLSEARAVFPNTIPAVEGERINLYNIHDYPSARPITLDEWELAGGGAQGESYNHREREDIMLKLFSTRTPMKDVADEVMLEQEIAALGIPCPAAGELVEAEGRYGIVFTRVKNKVSFCRACGDDPTLTPDLARRAGRMLKAMHGIFAPKTYFPNHKYLLTRMLKENTTLTSDQRGLYKRLLRETPNFDRCLHGDFQFGNIITNGAEDYFIDLGMFSYGHPDFDLANFYYITHYLPEAVLEEAYHLPSTVALEFWKHFISEYNGGKSPNEGALLQRLTPYMLLNTLRYEHELGLLPAIVTNRERLEKLLV